MPISSALACAASSAISASASERVLIVSKRGRLFRRHPSGARGEIFVVEPIEIKAAHQRRFLDGADAAGLLLRSGRIFIEDLETALTMLVVGDDVQPEKHDLVL